MQILITTAALILLIVMFGHVRSQRKRLERQVASLKKNLLSGLWDKSRNWSKDLAPLAGSSHHMKLISSVRRRWCRRARRRAAESALSPVLQEVTLIIPTHKRHEYLARALDHYKSWNLKRLIVADSSPRPYAGTVAGKIDYRHMPEASYAGKFALVMPEVTTPYVLIAADDDLIAPFAVLRTVLFLNKNPDHACAQGWHAEFIRTGGQSAAWFALHVFAQNYHINAADSAGRMKQQSAMYLNNFYALHRTEVLRDTFCRVVPALPAEVLARSPDTMELAQALSTVVWGKHVVLRCLWIGRERMSGSLAVSGGDARQRMEDMGLVIEKLLELHQEALSGSGLKKEELATLFETYTRSWSEKKLPHTGPIEDIIKSSNDLGSFHLLKRVVEAHRIPLESGSSIL